MIKQYNNLINSGKIKADAAQILIADKLAQIAQAITLPKKTIFGKAKKIKGLYIYGAVGRGKSMLMDIFFDSLDITQKSREHFHEFMLKIHDKMHQIRGQDDIINIVAKEFASDLKVLCFDEYEVNDVTNAMILSRLFKAMSELGVIFIITSNKHPSDHYIGGLQRESYVQFCKYLEQVVEIVTLDSPIDYRLTKEKTANNFYIGVGYEAKQFLKNKFKILGIPPLTEITVHSKGREIKLKASGRVAWSSFNQLCATALGATDYIEIAKMFDVIFIEDIPSLTEDLRNETKRFITLVDVFYENGTIVIANFEDNPKNLSNEFEYKRTASRLEEMQGKIIKNLKPEERF